jgi:hypothetical protein
VAVVFRRDGRSHRVPVPEPPAAPKAGPMPCVPDADSCLR